MDSPRYTIGPEVMARQVGSETVILDLASGTYFGLDEVGSRVWQLLQAGHDQDAICASLLEEYEVAPDALARDVDTLLQELEQRGLVQRANA